MSTNKIKSSMESGSNGHFRRVCSPMVSPGPDLDPDGSPGFRNVNSYGNPDGNRLGYLGTCKIELHKGTTLHIYGQGQTRRHICMDREPATATCVVHAVASSVSQRMRRWGDDMSSPARSLVFIRAQTHRTPR